MEGGMSGAAAGAAAAGAAIANAIKASGVLVRVEPDEFLTLVHRQEAPLVVQSTSRIFGVRHHYLCSYKGLAFYTKSPIELPLPAGVERVIAKGIHIPG